MKQTSIHSGKNPRGCGHPVHPLKNRAKVLLTSVFGPYAQDDEYGSRQINPMELYHNQVTRTQGPFSLRMFHRSWGLMLIQANISAPCDLLDFPTLNRFIEQICRKRYDIVGISSIASNIAKTQKMCELVRKYQPQATIVVGGHIAGIANLPSRIDADYIARGEGIEWFRKFLGEDTRAHIRHPLIVSSLGSRMMGISLKDSSRHTAATLIPGVGCPLGCNFCSTSAMFGGKGKFVNFYETGEELFHVMCGIEKMMKARSFFVMDENFLLHKKRAMQLLEKMEQYKKPWALYVFSSANVLTKYSIDELVRLGVTWVWMGIEGEQSDYKKLEGIETRSLVQNLQSHGVRVLGSSIIGLENHTPKNMDNVIDYAISHDTDFHQFMLYTPVPGTPFYEEQREKSSLLPETQCNEADAHGQLKFNFLHPHIKSGLETNFLIRAFQRDFETNGPSVIRMARTLLQGWKKYKKHPDRRIRKRFRMESKGLSTAYAGALWAAERWFRFNTLLQQKIASLRKEFNKEFGLRTKLLSPTIGRFILRRVRRENRKLLSGWTYEPATFFERNYGRRKPPRKLHRHKQVGYSLAVSPQTVKLR